ncbi:c6 finger domain-containing protein [Ophiostoma piceae UAMH 11346]|uniref:C6 finger domain-containing protein n=1 Tax=Ophiostoma piceae (strain UAMH 11346) TaxID=1262450 RepID=S3C8Y1_OPHP1|nr:c6 finger domain-containing protein [Ophiostoma piceae UAMH 11346]
MYTPRQKRQSCEACRTRKLKCTGDGHTCARCTSLNVTCTYQYMGIPGRPSKLRRQEQRARPVHNASGNANANASASASAGAGAGVRPPLSPAGLAPSPPTTDHGSDGLGDVVDAMLDLGSLPLYPPDFAGTGDFGCLPLELLGQCHSTRHGRDEVDEPDTRLYNPLSPDQSRDPLHESCSCADDVASFIRTLRRCDMSHAMLRDLRVGADLMGQLLACSVCYNLSKPPRLTIQNVLLIGRLMHQVTIGYRRHLRWVQETWDNHADTSRRETVHLVPHRDNGADSADATTVGIQVSSRMFRDLIVDGLRMDIARLTELASQFALRQYNRHLVGHEMCPDPEGRCWRERYDIDTDPLDICPKSAASRTLTPCFRIVDAVRAGIKVYAEEVDRTGRLVET